MTMRKKVRAHVRHGTHEKAAALPPLNNEFFGRRVALRNEVFGRGDEVVNVLRFLLHAAAVVPRLSELAPPRTCATA